MADQFPELTAARARNQIVQNAIADERRPDLGESDPLRAARPTVYFAEGRPRDLRNDLAAAELSNLDRARFDAGGEETRIEYAVSRETPPMRAAKQSAEGLKRSPAETIERAEAGIDRGRHRPAYERRAAR